MYKQFTPPPKQGPGTPPLYRVQLFLRWLCGCVILLIVFFTSFYSLLALLMIGTAILIAIFASLFLGG